MTNKIIKFLSWTNLNHDDDNILFNLNDFINKKFGYLKKCFQSNFSSISYETVLTYKDKKSKEQNFVSSFWTNAPDLHVKIWSDHFLIGYESGSAVPLSTDLQNTRSEVRKCSGNNPVMTLEVESGISTGQTSLMRNAHMFPWRLHSHLRYSPNCNVG